LAVFDDLPPVPDVLRGSGKHFERVDFRFLRLVLRIELHKRSFFGVGVPAEQSPVCMQRLSHLRKKRLQLRERLRLVLNSKECGKEVNAEHGSPSGMRSTIQFCIGRLFWRLFSSPARGSAFLVALDRSNSLNDS